MIKIKEISEGKFTLTRKDKMLPGIYHKIEKVAENSNFYCLWSDKKHFCLYDAKSNRYALKSSTLSDAQTFSHTEYYSEESQSFVAYRSDMRYAHIIYEDGTFETQTFKYVGAEKNGLRPVQDFKNKWYYYDTTERKRIKETRHGIQLGTEGRLGEMFPTGQYLVYYTSKKLRIFASVNNVTIKSRDYFETVEQIEGRFFIGKLYGKNVYTIIADYHIITPIGYYTSMPQYIKEHNLFIAMKENSWCVIQSNGKEIQNHQWTDDCFFFTNKHVFNKKKESSYWKIFNREDGQEVITRWKNIRLYNGVFFVDTDTESLKRISTRDIQEESLKFMQLLQNNSVKNQHSMNTVKTEKEGNTEHKESSIRKTHVQAVEKKDIDTKNEIPPKIDYYIFVKHANIKDELLIAKANCEVLRGATYVVWFIAEKDTFVVTESRRTKVHKILYKSSEVHYVKELIDKYGYPSKFNQFQCLGIEDISSDMEEENFEGYVYNEILKCYNDSSVAPSTPLETNNKAALNLIPKVLDKVILTKDKVILSVSKGLCPVITLKELCQEILLKNSSGISGSVTIPDSLNNYFINRKEAIEKINTQVVQSFSMYNWIELLLNSVVKNVKSDKTQQTNTTNKKANATYPKQIQQKEEKSSKIAAAPNVISNKKECSITSVYLDNTMNHLDEEYKQGTRITLNLKPEISELLVLDEIWPSGRRMFQRRRYIGKNDFVYILLDSSIDNIIIENENIHYHIIGEGKDKRFSQDFRGNSNSLIRSTIHDKTKRVLLFKQDDKNEIIFIDEIRCIGYKFVEEEDSHRSLISFNFISLLRYQTNVQDNSKPKLEKEIELEEFETQNSQNETIEYDNNIQKTYSMTKLQELYETREKLQSLGIEPNADLERQLAALEEEIVKSEIVPNIKKAVEPVLKPVKRNLVFVVEYYPKEGVHVQLSRKRNEVANAVSEEKRTVSPQTIEPASNSSLQKLRVTFPDGEVIYERWVIETLGKTIIKLGIQKVANVCDFDMGSSLLHPAGVSLVSKVYDSKYGVYQRPLEGEWLLFSNSNTLTKKRQIEYLAKVLGVRLTVEVV